MNEREMNNRRKGWRQTCCEQIKRGQKQKKGGEVTYGRTHA